MRLGLGFGALLLMFSLAACGGQPVPPTIQPLAPTQALPTTALLPTSPPIVFVPMPTPRPQRETAESLTGQLQVAAVGRAGSIDAPQIVDGDLYVFEQHNNRAYRLTVDTADDFSPVWNLDGSRLFFVSNRDGTPYLYSFSVMNTNPIQRVSAFPAGDEREPSLSPDGFNVVFTSSRGGNDAIYRMSIDGRGVQQLTILSSRDYEPDWSPDNTWIVHTSDRNGNPDLYMMDTNGGQSTRLTDWEGVDSQPAFSPDGRRVAFISDRSGNPEVYILALPQPPAAYGEQAIYSAIDVLGGNIPPFNLDTDAPIARAYRLTNGRYPKSNPSWFVDENGGFKLLYSEERPGPEGTLHAVYAMNDDGTDVTLVSPFGYSMVEAVVRPIRNQ